MARGTIRCRATNPRASLILMRGFVACASLKNWISSSKRVRCGAMKCRLALLLTLLFPLCACTRTGHLYNLTTGEMSTFTFSYGRDRGTIHGSFKSGEIVSGEYSVMRGGAMSWGSVYASVYSPSGSASGSGSGVGILTAGQARGAAMLTGDKGSLLDCEFIVGMGGHGTGACRDKQDTKYRMMF
jgi:hypothetical protein